MIRVALTLPLWVASLLAIQGCASDQTDQDSGTPVTCDGTGEPLSFAWWTLALDPQTGSTLQANGFQWFQIDADCRFATYNGDTADLLRAWRPVRTGVLADAELSELLTELQPTTWHAFTDNGAGAEFSHAEWTEWTYNGQTTRCEGGCDDASTKAAAIRWLRDLDARGEPHMPSDVRVAVFPSYTNIAEPWAISWGAESPLTRYLQSPPQTTEFSDLGLEPTPEDLAWFLDEYTRFIERDVTGLPQEAIDLAPTNGGDRHSLYIAPVPPL